MTTESDNDNIRDIDCIEAIDQLYAYLDGEVDDARRTEEIEHHIKHCHSCFTRSQLERELTKRMKKAARKPAPETLKKRLNKLMDN